MKLLRNAIIGTISILTLSISSCDSGGSSDGGLGNSETPLAAPESLVGSTLTLIPKDGPLSPLCEIPFRIFDYREGQVLNKDGVVMLLNELTYTHEDIRGKIFIEFNNTDRYIIRLIFTGPTSGTFRLFDVNIGATCNDEGIFTLQKNSPAAVGVGIGVAP